MAAPRVVDRTERTPLPPAPPMLRTDQDLSPQLAQPAIRWVESAPRAAAAAVRADAAQRPWSPPAPRTVEPERSSTPAPEPHDVHVHIGRIEVTAVPAEPTLKRVPRDQARRMSLAEYLKQRNGGGR
ncbi:MAG TPA: hypothetical protein VF424_02435 [Vicinamibacterales bacterium]